MPILAPGTEIQGGLPDAGSIINTAPESGKWGVSIPPPINNKPVSNNPSNSIVDAVMNAIAPLMPTPPVANIPSQPKIEYNPPRNYNPPHNYLDNAKIM